MTWTQLLLIGIWKITVNFKKIIQKYAQTKFQITIVKMNAPIMI